MGGTKGGTSTSSQNTSGNSTSSTTPPGWVLQQYQNVFGKANAAADTPFQPYTGEFVAPVNPTQTGAIGNISNAAGSWSPYIGAGAGALTGGLGAASGALNAGQAAGTGLGAASLNLTGTTSNAAQPFNTAAGNFFGSGYNAAQPYNTGATGLALAGTGAVNPSAVDPNAIAQYSNPYLANVLGGTVAQLQNQFGQQRQGLTGNQILSGSFGTDRGGVGQSVLANQQDLALGSTVSGLLNSNYAQALAAAQQQQGVGLGAAQANRAAIQGAVPQLLQIGGQQFGQGVGTGSAVQGLGNQVFNQGLGAANQYLNIGNTLFGQGNTAAGTYGNLGIGAANTYSGLGTANLSDTLNQGNAQLGAGTVPQQTQQAQDTAQYQQFLQEQGYPFQIAQFLAGISGELGALSGSTTTTEQTGSGSGQQTTPQPFFSDERLKENIHVVGKTNDGQSIIRFNYKGQPHTQLGMIAQDVLKHHPEAVGKEHGFLTVDYDAATRDAVRTKRADGGLVPRALYANGGGTDVGSILAAHQAMYPGSVNAMGLTRTNASGQAVPAGPRGMQLSSSRSHGALKGTPGKVDAPKVEFSRQPEQTGLGSAISGLNTGMATGKNLTSLVKGGADALVGSAASGTPAVGTPGTPGYQPASPGYQPASGGLIGAGGSFSGQGWIDRNVTPLFRPSTSPSTSTGGIGAVTPLPPPPGAEPPAPASPGVPDATLPGGFRAADAGPAIDDVLKQTAASGGRIGRAPGGGLPYDDSGNGYMPQSNNTDPVALLAEQLSTSGPHSSSLLPQMGGGGGGKTPGFMNSPFVQDAMQLFGGVGSNAIMGSLTGGGVGSSGGFGGMSMGDATTGGLLEFKTGGAVGLRPAYDVGGALPYEDGDNGGYVPGSTPPNSIGMLASQHALGSEGGVSPTNLMPNMSSSGSGGGGGGGGVNPMQMAQTGMSFATALMALKTGGRAVNRRSGFQVGGAPMVDVPSPLDPPVVLDEPLPGGGSISPDKPSRRGLGLPVKPEPDPLRSAVAAPAERHDPAEEVRNDLRAEGLNPVSPRPVAASPGVATPSPAVVTPLSVRGASTGSPAPGAQAGSWDDMLERSERATAVIESGSPDPTKGWGTVGPETRYKDGRVDRPYGRYGVMGANVPAWTKQYYGQALTPEQFLADKEAQKTVYRGQYGDYIKKFGTPQKAAGAWFAGPQGLTSEAKDVLGTSVPWYMKRFTALYNGDPDPGARDPQAGGPQVAMPADPADPAATPGGAPAAAPQGLSPVQFDPRTGLPKSTGKEGFFDSGGWLDRNQREVASGLSFLGNMLGSERRTLLGSVGQGLAAAAPQYLQSGFEQQGMGQRQQGIGQEQQRIDISNRQQLMSLWSTLLARAAGYTRQGQPVPPELQGMIKSLEGKISAGGGGAPGGGPTPGDGATPVTPSAVSFAPQGGSGVSRASPDAPVTVTQLPPPPAPITPPSGAIPPTTPATSIPSTTGKTSEAPSSAGTPALDAEGLPTVRTTDPGFLARLDPNHNPVELARRAQESMQFDPNAAAQLLEQSRNESAAITREGFGIGPGGEKVYAPGGIERQAAEKRAPENAQIASQEAQGAKARQIQRNSLQHIAHALENFETGNLAATKAELQSTLKAMGVDIGNTATMNAAEFQTILKNAYQTMLNQTGGGPATDALRQEISHTIPSNEFQPEANKKILAMLMGQLDWQDKRANDYTAAYQKNRYLDNNAWQQAWSGDKANNPQSYMDKHYENLAVRGATPPPAEMKLNHTYVLEPAQAAMLGVKIERPTKYKVVTGDDGKRTLRPVQ